MNIETSPNKQEIYAVRRAEVLGLRQRVKDFTKAGKIQKAVELNGTAELAASHLGWWIDGVEVSSNMQTKALAERQSMIVALYFQPNKEMTDWQYPVEEQIMRLVYPSLRDKDPETDKQAYDRLSGPYSRTMSKITKSLNGVLAESAGDETRLSYFYQNLIWDARASLGAGLKLSDIIDIIGLKYDTKQEFQQLLIKVGTVE